MELSKRTAAEFFGTFWLVLGGCGSAVLATNPDAFGSLSIGFLGVSLAFGLTVLTMAYAVGHISGGHFNPAVSIGLLVAGKFSSKDLIPYIIAQVVAAIAASGVLYLIASGQPGWETGGFATNGWGEGAAPPGGYSMTAALVTEVAMTFFFLLVILGATDRLAPTGFAPVAIGLALCLIHLISIPVTNTSVNPARSTGPALFAQGIALQQLWLFWVAPIAGAALAGITHKCLLASKDEDLE